jgi:hypothetical protein
LCGLANWLFLFLVDVTSVKDGELWLFMARSWPKPTLSRLAAIFKSCAHRVKDLVRRSGPFKRTTAISAVGRTSRDASGIAIKQPFNPLEAFLEEETRASAFVLH